mmetsp:Transcript_4075/g.10928  ORF Transcript_4075/g.10928 Transcript_4075/m.10928 type:complete len:247 (-) Transcript_4075:353-1093(-)
MPGTAAWAQGSLRRQTPLAGRIRGNPRVRCVWYSAVEPGGGEPGLEEHAALLPRDALEAPRGGGAVRHRALEHRQEREGPPLHLLQRVPQRRRRGLLQRLQGQQPVRLLLWHVAVGHGRHVGGVVLDVAGVQRHSRVVRADAFRDRHRMNDPLQAELDAVKYVRPLVRQHQAALRGVVVREAAPLPARGLALVAVHAAGQQVVGHQGDALLSQAAEHWQQRRGQALGEGALLSEQADEVVILRVLR